MARKVRECHAAALRHVVKELAFVLREVGIVVTMQSPPEGPVSGLKSCSS